MEVQDQEGVGFNGTHQLLVYADDMNIVNTIVNIGKKERHRSSVRGKNGDWYRRKHRKN
jgi:hypothetical protein